MSERIGPTGERVMHTVRRLRAAAEMTKKELSGRLADVGRAIPVLGLSRLERGERHADADDLVALALALETTPNRLMLPGIDVPTATMKVLLTPEVSGTPRELWEWAQGETPILAAADSLWEEDYPGEHQYRFIADNKPYLLAPAVIGTTGAAREEKLGELLRAVNWALASGLTPSDVRMAAEVAISGTYLREEPES